MALSKGQFNPRGKQAYLWITRDIHPARGTPQAMSNLLQQGVEAHRRGDAESARRLYAQTIGVVKHNLALLAEGEGDHEAAIQLFRAALEADPARDETAGTLALSLLREGHYAEAWPLHERRRNLDHLRIPAPPSHWPEWRGESIAGKRLAVLGEQGLGDQIMFARFLEPLRAQGAEVRFACAPELVSLLGGQPTVSRADLDLWALAMSLPLLLGTTVETLPPPVALPVSWRGGSGIGVMVTGNPQFAKDRQRTPPPEIQAELLSLGRDLRPEATGARDFLDTAKIVADLDLVISIDTAVAHLSASMGVPTWILLPTPGNDWRWLRHRTDSPWYPSARLFRQPRPMDWRGVLRSIREALAF